MKTSGRFCLAATWILLSACASTGSDALTPDARSAAASAPRQTILLVSLEDGTVIRQTIDVDADICFKQNSASQTTCFSQGDAIINPLTAEVIGHEMIEDRIDLVAKSN